MDKAPAYKEWLQNGEVRESAKYLEIKSAKQAVIHSIILKWEEIRYDFMYRIYTDIQ